MAWTQHQESRKIWVLSYRHRLAAVFQVFEWNNDRDIEGIEVTQAIQHNLCETESQVTKLDDRQSPDVKSNI